MSELRRLGLSGRNALVARGCRDFDKTMAFGLACAGVVVASRTKETLETTATGHERRVPCQGGVDFFLGKDFANGSP